VTATDSHGHAGADVSDASWVIWSADGVENELPRTFALSFASANPGSGTRRIRYALPRAQDVSLSIVDVRGRVVAVLANGTVVMMYDTYDGNQVHVHIATSTDFGASISSDVIAYSFAPLTLLAATGSSTSNREFGDYQYLTSIGDTFYGAFAGLGDVNAGGSVLHFRLGDRSGALNFAANTGSSAELRILPSSHALSTMR
jgi:hypothetical protein